MLPTNLPKPKLFYLFGGVLISISLFLAFIKYIDAFPLLSTDVGGDDEIIEEIQELNQDLQTRRQEIEDLKKQVEEYRQKIIAQRNEAFSLKNQISILDTQIAKTKVEIKAKEQEIELTKLDIQEVKAEIALFKKRIKQQKEKIAEVLRVIYQNDEKSYLEILLMNDSLSDFFNAAKYIENLHTGLHKHLLQLKNIQNQLDSKLASIKAKTETLEKQKITLENQQERLEGQEMVKTQLLEDTQASEQKFKSLLQTLKEEQRSINSEIVSLEKTIRQRLEEQEHAQALKSLAGEKFIWPVPKNTITAYFHDPNYPYRYIFEHPAIDIRAKQGTTVRAAGSGYVAKTRRDTNCTGRYSYIMIIHASGLSTVYGHMSQISIEEGQFVVQGQKIGASGGIPGTCGAGRLTTGPHHHFEVRLNGIPVDPLGYLP